MIENLNYISDDELEQLICQVEESELVAAPPDLMERILEAAGFAGEQEEVVEQPAPAISVQSYHIKKKEFYAYCFRVITSVAAAVALVFLLPELSGGMEPVGRSSQKQYEKSAVMQMVPSYEEVIVPVPSKSEVLTVKVVPSKEEVFDDTGFIEKVLSNTSEWFNKENSDD